MLESMTAVCRAVASDAKLLVLHALAFEAELPATALAERTGLSLDGLSRHAGRLATLGLLERRRSGGRVFCRLAEAARASVGIVLGPKHNFAPIPAIEVFRRVDTDERYRPRTRRPAKRWQVEEDRRGTGMGIPGTCL